MCGIVGVLQYESEVPRKIRQRALKILFSDTMLRTEVRGEDATGIYQVHTDGDWAMAKKGAKVSDWLFLDDSTSEDPVVYSDFMESWIHHPREMTALIGHCRKATVGSRGGDNDDNHPFAVQVDKDNAILGIHNGTLNNHETIFKKLPKILKRQGTVDSESIFHLMFHLSEHGTKPWDGDMMKELGTRLDGAYACIVVNSRFPNQVATFREGRPMEFFLISPLNIVLICSERKFVQAALEKYEFIRELLDPELPELSSYDSALMERDYRIFDTTKPFPTKTPAIHSDLGRISESGPLKSFQTSVEKGWEAAGTTTKSTTSSSTGGTTTKPTTQAQVSKPSTPARILPAKATAKPADDEPVIVEVEIGNQEGEANQATERAKSMGICTHYDSNAEIAKSIGLNLPELKKLSQIEVANLVAKAHFNFGYAVHAYDAKGKTDQVRKKDRLLTKKLERASDKQKKAENRIWELKQLITILLSLGRASFGLHTKNVKIAVDSFAALSETRRQDILNQAAAIFNDSSVQQTVLALQNCYREAQERDRKKAQANKITSAD